MPLLSLLPDIFVPTFALSVNHVPLPPPIAKQIVNLSVTQHLNPPNSFSFGLNDPTLSLVAVSGGLFTEGSRIDLSLGFVDNTKQLIVGEISALMADFPGDGPI